MSTEAKNTYIPWGAKDRLGCCPCGKVKVHTRCIQLPKCLSCFLTLPCCKAGFGCYNCGKVKCCGAFNCIKLKCCGSFNCIKLKCCGLLKCFGYDCIKAKCCGLISCLMGVSTVGCECISCLPESWRCCHITCTCFPTVLKPLMLVCCANWEEIDERRNVEKKSELVQVQPQ